MFFPHRTRKLSHVIILIATAVVVVLLGIGGYMALSRRPTAELALEFALKKEKPQLEGLLVRVRTFRDQGDYKQAYAVLRSLTELNPSDEKLKGEVEATNKACNAEKALGLRKNLVCSFAGLEEPKFRRTEPEKPPPTTGAPGAKPTPEESKPARRIPIG